LATERVERKLAAILAADVAGYSRLMGATRRGRTNASRRISVRWPIRRSRSIELLGSVYDRFTEGFETADLAQAKSLLEHLR
jgi:hypothetical protein